MKNVKALVYLALATFSMGMGAALAQDLGSGVPAIAAISPGSGATGSAVTITGTNFSAIAASNLVYFGGVRAVVTAANPTSLTVTVPAGAKYAPVSATVGGLTAYSTGFFMPTYSGSGVLNSSSLTSPVVMSAGSGPSKIAFGDLDGDGKPDMVEVNSGDGRLLIYRNISTNGTLVAASFGAPVTLYGTGASPSLNGVSLADLDGDGRLDIVAASFSNNGISVFQNQSAPGVLTTNSFAPRLDLPVAGAVNVVVRDMDGDGLPDIVTANYSGNSVSVIRNISVPGLLTTNSFAPKFDLAAGSTTYDLAVGDMNGDGKPDIVAVNTDSYTVSIWQNQSVAGSLSSNSFAARVDLTGAGGGDSMGIGDIDGDGNLDIAVAANRNHALTVFRNKGLGGTITSNSFAVSVSFAVSGASHQLAMGDLDGDGKLDIAITMEQPSQLALFKNTGSPGSFTSNSLAAPVYFSTGYNAGPIAMGDLDGDGKPDLVVGNSYDNNLSIYRNTVTPGGAPVFTGQPTSRTNNVGTTATFTVTATGTQPLNFQWFFGANPLAQQTNATLTLTNVQLSQAGNYSVQVSNPYGLTNSAAAILTVVVPPTPVVGSVVAWGKNDYGQTNIPVGLSNVVAVAAGMANTMVLKSDGTVVVWGENNYGQLTIPAGVSNVTAIAAGWEYFVALKNNGTVTAWGRNEWGQANVPAGLSNVVAIAAGQIHTVALKSDGTVAVWGHSGNGETTIPAGLSGVTAISAGANDVVVLKNDGTVVAWGYNNYGQTTVPAGLSGVRAVSAGSNHSAALKSDGTVVVWGDNTYGQTNVPAGLSGVVAIAAGVYHTAALKSDGTVVAWGGNPNGETNVPAGLGGVAAIAAGGVAFHTVALLNAAPYITQQPQSMAATVGGTVNFNLNATGTQPFSYQWYSGANPLAQQTNATLTLANVQLSQAGNYSVQVSNAYGSTNSAVAVLTVVPPVCTPPPSGLVSWWRAEGNAYDYAGTNHGTLVGGVGYAAGMVGQAFNFNGGNNIVVPNQASLNPTNALTIECWVYARSRTAGNWTEDLVSKDAECSGTRQYELIIGDSQSHPGVGVFRPHVGVASGFKNFDGTTIVQSNTWYHVAETYDGATLKLYVNGNLDGQLAVTGPIVTSSEPVRIGGGAPSGCLQYYLDGMVDEPAIYNRALSAAEIQAIYNSGSLGKCFSPMLPSVVTQPASRTNGAGTTATFTVTAAGTPPLAYQWYFGANPLAQQTNATLALSNVQSNQAGNYSVQVTNPYGVTNSAVAVLTVGLPPTITQQLVGKTNLAGTTVVLTVTADGTQPFSYRWLFNGQDLSASTGVITTIAGTRVTAYNGDGIQATNANLYNPHQVAFDAAGNLYIADAMNSRIRKVSPSGIISTVAGNGTAGFSGDGGPATNASLNYPLGLVVDAAGNLYFTDNSNQRIRKVDKNGIITTVAGNGSTAFAGDGGQATNAGFNNPYGLAIDTVGNLYVADTFHQRIRKIATNGIITTVAGNGSTGYSGDGGLATSAMLRNPNGAWVDASGNLFIGDTDNGRVRKVNTSGIITTVAGNGSLTYAGDGGAATSASLNHPYEAKGDAFGNLYIPDFSNNRVRKVGTNGIITTIAGKGTAGYSGDGGTGTNAMLNGPLHLAFDASGNLFITDYFNNIIRKLGTGLSTKPNLTISGNTLTISNATTADAGNYTVQVSNPYGSVTSVVATVSILVPPGIVSQPASRTNVVGTTATFAVTATGTQPLTYQWYFGANPLAQQTNSTLTLGNVQMSQAGNYTVQVSNAYGVTNSSAALLTVVQPPVITQQPASQTNLAGSTVVLSVMADGTQPFSYRWMFNGQDLSASTGIITTIAGTGLTASYNGDGMAATNANLYNPHQAAFDSAGNLYIADAMNSRIRKVSPSGIISTVAGNGTQGFSGDGGPATNASLNYPLGLAVDAAGNVYFSDNSNQRIRKVDKNGIITTVAGNGSTGYTGDGGAATNAGFNNPYNIALDAAGNLYVADTFHQCIRKVATNGIITTVAGNGSGGYSGDGGLATSATLQYPNGAWVDAAGNLFIGDTDNGRVRKVSTNGIITTVAGNGSLSYSGDGGAATNASLNHPYSAIGDAFGNLYIADFSNNRVRKVDTNGVITTIAGTGATGYSGDGGNATNATLNGPLNLVLDAAGNLFITDYFNSVIRKLGAGPGAKTNFTIAGNTLTLTNVTAADAGNYTVQVSNPYGSTNSAVATVTIVFAPSIVTQPISQTNLLGTTASFSVTAGGTQPLTYQWKLNGTNLVGATNALLTLNNVQPADAGTYVVQVSSPYGATNSLGATLTVNVPPYITGQPASRTNLLGTTATFSVDAGGTGPLSYQWNYNETNLIAGATNAVLTLTNAQLADAGLYSVLVSSPYGTILSSNAVLTVDRAPVADASATLALLVSANGSNATVVLDGTLSSDPDGDALQYAWTKTGQTNVLASGVVAVVVLPVGNNSITLTVNDGFASSQQTILVEVLTVSGAVERLMTVVNDSTDNKQALISSLKAALAAIDRSNPTAAINQLQAFQSKVGAQISPLDPDLAQSLIDDAQDIIDALGGSGPGHNAVVASAQGKGKLHLNFAGSSRQLYIIEASTDLVNWEMIGVVRGQSDGSLDFEDAAAPQMPRRFYRIVTP